MAEGRSTEGIHGADAVDDAADDRTTVQLVYRPQSADALAALRVRERIKRTGLVLRGVFLALWVGQWLLAAMARGTVDMISTVLVLIVVLVVWGYPRLQAAHVQRTVGWQGEYHATVSAAGITCRTDHSTLVQKWSAFQGYRETAGHFVLLSRDPNITCLGVLPKRGVHEAAGVDRLRAVLDQHLTRA